MIGAFQSGDRHGTYWGIRTDIGGYELTDSIPCDPVKTQALAQIPTRLRRLEDDVQEELINWGYAVCDAAMRKYVVPGASAPVGFPYPASAVG